MADDITLGELGRRIARVERDVAETARAMVPAGVYDTAHRALEDTVERLGASTAESLARVERTSLERRKALQDRDEELARAITELRDEHRRDVKAVREEIKALSVALDQKAAKRTEWSRQLKVTVFSVGGAVLAALLGAWVTALLTAKGIK